jgi:hypothetical protein
MAYAAKTDLKTYLGISGSGDDTLLEVLLTRAQALVDAYCGRTFEAAADVTRYFDAELDVEGRRLWLDHDLCQITTVTNGDGVPVTAYVSEPRNDSPWYALTLKESSSVAWTYMTTPESAIAVKGRWAYSVTPPADVVHATLRLAGFLYRQKDAQAYETTAAPDGGMITVPQSIPRDVRAMLWLYRQRVYRRSPALRYDC